MPLDVNEKNKIKRKHQISIEIRVFARIVWLMFIVTVTEYTARYDEMKLRCEIIQISFPFTQAPPFKCLVPIKKNDYE